MGGTNQKNLDISNATGRIHQNNGEVHIHDDKNSMKVAVPVAEFMKLFGAWKDAPIQPLILIDSSSRTQAIISMKAVNNEMDVDIKLAPVKLGKNLQALVDFADGK